MAFPTNTREDVKEWFNNIPSGSITSFRELVYTFSNQLASSKKRKNDRDSLLSVVQKKSGGLRKYIHCFNTKRLKVGTCNDDIAMVTFMAGLRKSTSKHMLRSLYLNTPKNFDFTMARAKDYVLLDEALDLL